MSDDDNFSPSDLSEEGIEIESDGESEEELESFEDEDSEE